MRISVSENKNEININGPITIREGNFISNLEYSDNFDVSFEYKASYVPTDRNWHEILVGKLIFIKNRNDDSNSLLLKSKINTDKIEKIKFESFSRW